MMTVRHQRQPPIIQWQNFNTSHLPEPDYRKPSGKNQPWAESSPRAAAAEGPFQSTHPITLLPGLNHCEDLGSSSNDILWPERSSKTSPSL